MFIKRKRQKGVISCERDRDDDTSSKREGITVRVHQAKENAIYQEKERAVSCIKRKWMYIKRKISGEESPDLTHVYHSLIQREFASSSDEQEKKRTL